MRRPERADLPDNLSDLLELSVYDAMLCEEDPKYELNMGVWQKPNGACQVCMAGAVMAKTRGFHRRVRWLLDDLPEKEVEDRCRYSAIDNMRRGDFGDAAIDMGIGMSSLVADDAKAQLRSEEFRLGTGSRAGHNRYPWKEYLAAAAVLRDNGF